jgi:hypothetical protein
VPALIFELAIHIVPMLVGAWMSLLHLPQFYSSTSATGRRRRSRG